MTSLALSFDQSLNPIARFNGDLFYRIDGDRAELGASLAIFDPNSFERQPCLLQLWACPSANAPDGIKVAERLVSGAGENLVVDTLALPPAGPDAFAMVMTLVSVSQDGAVILHDIAGFDRPQGFIQPQLQGALKCEFADGHVDLAIESIRNPRSAENLSGSLCLELWALGEPYRGGAFSGQRLASAELGMLAGGEEWLHNSFRLDLAPLPVSASSLVLMLREWTEAGYVTRDYRAVQEPVTAAVAQEAVAEVLEPVTVAVEATEVEEAAPAVVTPVSEQAGAEAVADAVDVPKKVVQAAEAAGPETPAEVREKPEAKRLKKAEKSDAEPVNAEPSGLVSVNDATAAELVKVKGISPRLASAIVAGRPYASVEDLLKVRGIGERSMQRLRPFLGL